MKRSQADQAAHDHEPAGLAREKRVPQDAATRERIRQKARDAAGLLDRRVPPGRDRLRVHARRTLDALGLGEEFLGFTMVCISNEFWCGQFAAVRPEDRLLLLPHCLRNAEVCRGTYNADGLVCGGCGACVLYDLRAEAEAMGYTVLVAEGTPVVVRVALDGHARAILGVACLDSLDKAFDRIAQLGIPNVAVPLLVDGCRDTVAEVGVVRRWLHCRAGPAAVRTRTYAPLLRRARGLFDPEAVSRLLAPLDPPGPPGGETAAIARDWLTAGGKRFRPFVTLAAYAALALGPEALHPEADLSRAFSPALERLAVAVEILHKASLVHDDIEDGDSFRDGRETVHRRHGVPVAVNVGDYLVGLGYRCVSACAEELGAECAHEMIGGLVRAHLKLCRGQGAELQPRVGGTRAWTSVDLQAVYALKTAPAFEAAIYVGVRAAIAGGAEADLSPLGAFARYLGVAYQVSNDVQDWTDDEHHRRIAGRDWLAGRPTMLSAFAAEAAGGAVDLPARGRPPSEQVDALRRIYHELGVFEKARRLVDAYRRRAFELAAEARPAPLAEVMRFIAETVL